MNEDELDRLLRNGAAGPDRALADLLTRMRHMPGPAPVPSRSLTAQMDGAGDGSLGQRVPLPARRTLWRPSLRRLAAMAPALQGVLAGALAAAVAALAVLVVHSLEGDRHLPVRVISPASASVPAPATTESVPETPPQRAGTPLGGVQPSTPDQGRAGSAKTTHTHEPSSTDSSSSEPPSSDSSSTDSSSTSEGAARE